MTHYLTLHLISFFLFHLKGTFLILPIITLSEFVFHNLLQFFNLLCISDVKSYYELFFSHLITHFFDSASQYECFFTSHFQFPVLFFAVCSFLFYCLVLLQRLIM